MSTGPAYWDQPEFTDYPALDGSLLSTLWSQIEERVVGGPVALARMGDGTGVVVRRLRTNTDPEVDADYEWTIPDEAVSEVDWRRIQRIIARNALVWWIPPRTESIAYVLSGGTQTITLKRPDAAYSFASFDRAQHPASASADGVELTVVHTGTPASGEVKIEGFSLVTASDAVANSLLEVTYYPAFRVWIPKPGLTSGGWNRVTRPLVLTEVGGSDV